MLSTNTEEENEYVYCVLRRAETGKPDALYEKGALYDLGDYVKQDKLKASKLFKEAAENGHAHSMWIHACELLWGLGSYPQSVKEGLLYLEKAIENGSGEACITKARLYKENEFGFTSNEKEVIRLRKLAKKYDDTIFDPYA